MSDPTETTPLTYYCIESRHPSANGALAGLVSGERFFVVDEPATGPEGAPICPACGRAVSALAADDANTYPSAIQALAERGA